MNIEYKLIKASQMEDFKRPFWWTFTEGTDKNVLPGDIKILRSHALRLYKNLGPLRVAIREKAMYSVGRHWKPVFTGSDLAYKVESQDWLIHNWYPICNVMGEEFHFQKTLQLLSVNCDVFGEMFIYLTQSENGYPAIQLIPPHRIDQPRQNGALSDSGRLTGDCYGGKWKGCRVEYGVVKSEQGRAIAYSVLGNEEYQDDLVTADDMIRIREIDLGDETRSAPTMSHGINQGRSILSLLENEQEFLEAASRIALIENNEIGGLDPNDPQNALSVRNTVSGNPDQSGNNGGFVENDIQRVGVQEWSESGQSRYFKSKSGGNVQAFQFTRPAQEWQDFMDKLSRFLIDPIWPWYLVDKEGELGGANVRGLAARANRLVNDRQDLLERVARKIVQYAIAKGSKLGRISQNEQWWMWTFTKPARITVDFGRDAKSEILEVEAGLLDPAEVIEARGGGTYADWCLQRYRNAATEMKIRAQVEAETGEDLSNIVPSTAVSGVDDASDVEA